MKQKFVPIAWLLAMMMLMPTLAACAQTEAPSEDTTIGIPMESITETTTEEVTTELTDGLEDKNMDGFELRIKNNSVESLSWAEPRLTASEDDLADVLMEAIYYRNLEVEERFNATISVTATGAPRNEYANLVAAGEDLYDVILVCTTFSAGMIPYVADFSQIPHISLDEEWWSPNATETFHVGDKYFAAAGAYSLSSVSAVTCMVFNKELHKQLNNGENIYDIVREGKWTVDKMYADAILATKDLNGDGVHDKEDQCGLNGTFKTLMNMMIIGSDMHYVSMDDDNYPVFDLASNEKFVGMLEKITQFHKTNPSVYHWPSGIGSSTYPRFSEGKVLYNVTKPHSMMSLREMEGEFGVIPVPKYDEDQVEYYSNMSNGEVSTLPRTFSKTRLENIGIMLEAMAFKTHFDVVPVYKDVVLDMKISRDEDSAEMLDIVFAGITYDYGVNVWQSEICYPVVEDLLFAKKDAIVSHLTSVKPTVDSLLVNLKKSIEEMP